MAHVGKGRLPEKSSAEISAQFLKLATGGNRRARSVMSELLTETERLMLAKRLAAILLLAQEASYYRIEQALMMSTSTLKRLDRQLIAGEFSFLENLMRKRNERAELFKTLGVVLRAGLPPRGKGRWSNIQKLLYRLD